MKPFLVLLIALSSIANAQDTSSQKISVYGGLLHTELYSISNAMERQKETSMLLAATGEYNLPFDITFFGRVGYDVKSSFSHLFVRKSWQNIGVTFGSAPRPIAIIRPFPFAADGQFEPRTAKTIPGAANGGYVSLNTSGVEFQGGLYQNALNRPELNAGIVISSKARLAGYHTSDETGIALGIKGIFIDVTSYWNSNGTTSVYIKYPNLFGSVILDAVYKYDGRKFDWLEFGWVREMPAVFGDFSGEVLVGVTYRQPTKELCVHLFVHT